MTWVNNGAVLLIALALGGCLRARFIDERPYVPPDLVAPPDLGGTVDLSDDLAEQDATGVIIPAQDASADLPATERIVATGTFEGRGGHFAQGSATLVDLENGQRELRFGSDFLVGVGTDVYLSSRSTLFDPAEGQITIDPTTDRSVGPLAAPSGEQSYIVPGSAGGRRYVWVYCRPFNVEIGVALLSP